MGTGSDRAAIRTKRAQRTATKIRHATKPICERQQKPAKKATARKCPTYNKAEHCAETQSLAVAQFGRLEGNPICHIIRTSADVSRKQTGDEPTQQRCPGRQLVECVRRSSAVFWASRPYRDRSCYILSVDFAVSAPPALLAFG